MYNGNQVALSQRIVGLSFNPTVPKQENLPLSRRSRRLPAFSDGSALCLLHDESFFMEVDYLAVTYYRCPSYIGINWRIVEKLSTSWRSLNSFRLVMIQWTSWKYKIIYFMTFPRDLIFYVTSIIFLLIQVFFIKISNIAEGWNCS